jgi:predicted kinase
MYTLNNFYQSKEWRGLLAQIKSERVNEDGNIICEYCNKPVTRAYDIIGHHKEELTEDNVNDYNISLNKDNIALVHHRCHNYIHNKLGYSIRNIYLVYGPPLSGKTTWVNNNKIEGDLIINLDDIWECISGCDRYVKPNRLKAIVFKIRDTLIDSVRYRVGKWQNAYIVGGYPLRSERERLCKELGAKEIYINTSKDECINRLINLDNEKIIKEEYMKYIEVWFSRYTPPYDT